jgi:ankyrin repeat protein
MLLEKGADTSLQNLAGHTPLQSAVAYKYTPIVQILLKQNADTHDETDLGLYAWQ